MEPEAAMRISFRELEVKRPRLTDVLEHAGLAPEVGRDIRGRGGTKLAEVQSNETRDMRGRLRGTAVDDRGSGADVAGGGDRDTGSPNVDARAVVGERGFGVVDVNGTDGNRGRDASGRGVGSVHVRVAWEGH